MNTPVKCITDQPAPDEMSSKSLADATDAFHNLAGFMGVLFRINERVGLVSMDEKEAHHADQ